MAFGNREMIWVLRNQGFDEIIRQTQIPFQGEEGLEGYSSCIGHHEEFRKPLDGVRFMGFVNGKLLTIQEEGSVCEFETGKIGVLGMGEFVEESGVPAKETEDGDSEAEELLLVREEAGGEEATGASLDGVFEKAGSLEIRLGVDDMI